MTEYGGWGGIEGGRPLDLDDAFEMTVERVLGARIRESSEFACAMWSALADVEWRHENGDSAGYTFRAAGDMIAAIRGSGDYMDWYCCGPYAAVNDEIRQALAARGWTPEFPYREECKP